MFVMTASAGSAASGAADADAAGASLGAVLASADGAAADAAGACEAVLCEHAATANSAAINSVSDRFLVSIAPPWSFLAAAFDVWGGSSPFGGRGRGIGSGVAHHLRSLLACRGLRAAGDRGPGHGDSAPCARLRLGR